MICSQESRVKWEEFAHNTNNFNSTQLAGDVETSALKTE